MSELTRASQAAKTDAVLTIYTRRHRNYEQACRSTGEVLFLMGYLSVQLLLASPALKPLEQQGLARPPRPCPTPQAESRWDPRASESVEASRVNGSMWVEGLLSLQPQCRDCKQDWDKEVTQKKSKLICWPSCLFFMTPNNESAGVEMWRLTEPDFSPFSISITSPAAS